LNVFTKIIGVVLIVIAGESSAATEYGKIVGIETRAWGLHIQTDFGFSMTGCEAVVNQPYMYDFVYSNNMNSSVDAKVEVSIIFAAFAANKDVSFHIYDCNTSRPKIGYIRVK
jgi:hypothetical protein